MTIDNPFKRSEKAVVIKIRWEKEKAHIVDMAVNADWSLLALACLPAGSDPMIDPSTASAFGIDSLRVCLYQIPTGKKLMKVGCCQQHVHPSISST